MIPINFFPFSIDLPSPHSQSAESKPQIGKPLMSKNGLIDSSINRLSRGQGQFICSYHCIYTENLWLFNYISEGRREERNSEKMFFTLISVVSFYHSPKELERLIESVFLLLPS